MRKTTLALAAGATLLAAAPTAGAADYAVTGGKLLAIPHNGNLSGGRMFELHQFNGDPMTPARYIQETWLPSWG